MRIRLPDTRSSVTKKVSCGAWEMYITVGFYDNRQPGEVFVVIAKHGNHVAGLMDGIAILISMLLQYGVPFATIRNKFVGSKFEPNDEEFKSLLDALVKTVNSLVQDGDGDVEKGHGYGPDEGTGPEAGSPASGGSWAERSSSELRGRSGQEDSPGSGVHPVPEAGCISDLPVGAAL